MKSDFENPQQHDGHAHVFCTSDKPIKDARYIPNYDAHLDDWLSLLDANSLKGGTLVQPSFLGTDNSRLLNSISEARGRGYAVNGAAVVSLETDMTELEDLTRQHIVALRLNLIERPLPNFTSDHWTDFLERVNSAGLAVEIHLEAARILPALEIIQKKCQSVILDHYALVENVSQLEHLLTNIDRSELSIKRSAPYRLPIQPANNRQRVIEDLDACLLQNIPCEKIPIGSDWPHTRFEHLRADETASHLSVKKATN